ncbi:SDR family NAD(P)-dependent oxidoreductase [Streptomyces asiaticus]
MAGRGSVPGASRGLGLEIAKTAVQRFGKVDVLVDNAGRGLLGALEEITDAEARSLFDLNVFGLINMTRAVLTSSLSTAAQRIPAYDGTPAHATLDWIDTADHTQLGDPVKGAALIYEVTSGDKLPGHLALGRDAIERQLIKIRSLQDDLATWQDKSAATACDDAA